MNERTKYKILRDIYHILSYASSEHLDAASREPDVPRGIAVALGKLSEGASTLKSLRVRQDSATKKTKAKRSDSPLSELAERSALLATKAATIEFAKMLGLRLNVSRKDGLARVRARLISMLNTLPENEKTGAIRQIQGSNMPELEGWLSVINQKK